MKKAVSLVREDDSLKNNWVEKEDSCSLPHRQLRKSMSLRVYSCSSFAAAQAAQKVDEALKQLRKLFAAAQAAQKNGKISCAVHVEFAAAQAAQKLNLAHFWPSVLFAAAQAAQK